MRKPKRVVRKGQVYSILNIQCERFQVRVVKLHGGKAVCLVLHTKKPRLIELTARTLARGGRGTRLVKEAPGVKPKKPPEGPPPRIYKEHTASEFRKVTAPRGLEVVTEDMKEAYEMTRQGKPVPAVAAHFGVSRNVISRWCDKVASLKDLGMLEVGS